MPCSPRSRPARRERYSRLAEVCRDIESAGADSPLAAATAGRRPAPAQARRTDVDLPAAARHRGIARTVPRDRTARGPARPGRGGRGRGRPARPAKSRRLKAKGRSAGPGHQAALPRLAAGTAGGPAQAPAARRAGPGQPRPRRSPNRSGSTSRSSSSAPTPSPARTPRPSPRASTPPSSTSTRPTSGSPRWTSSRIWWATCPPPRRRVGYEPAAAAGAPNRAGPAGARPIAGDQAALNRRAADSVLLPHAQTHPRHCARPGRPPPPRLPLARMGAGTGPPLEQRHLLAVRPARQHLRRVSGAGRRPARATCR